MNKLEFPNITHLPELQAMWQEWRELEGNTDFLNGFISGKDLEEFVTTKQERTDRKITRQVMLLVSEQANRVLGITRMRANIENFFDIPSAGHIALGIRPSERRNGYAREILRLSLAELGSLGLKKALITCHEDNLGSRRAIEANGGIFDGYNSALERKYWITILENE